MSGAGEFCRVESDEAVDSTPGGHQQNETCTCYNRKARRPPAEHDLYMPQLRLDGDLIVFVLGNTTQNHNRTVKPVFAVINKNHVQGQSRGMFNVVNNVDRVPSNVHSSRKEALLYVYEDKEAVIKMIIKRKKPDNETCFQNPQSCS